MSEQEEPFEESSGFMESPLPEPWERSPRNTSESPTGSEFQRQITEAVSGSEFTDTTVHGIPMRRQGKALHISYDQAIQFVWGDPQ